MVCNRFILSVIMLLAVSCVPALAAPIDTSFVYQGQLKHDGLPADGVFDLKFRLLDGNGVQIANPSCVDELDVIGGLFQVSLDFGNVFDGQERFLEISVRAGGTPGVCLTGAYTVLTPNQEITATPYAQTALSVPGIDGHSLNAADGSPVDVLFVANNGHIGIGTNTPDGPVHIVSTFTPPNGVQLDQGLMLGSNGLASYKWVQSYGGPLALNQHGNNVGIGTTTPTAKLHIDGNPANLKLAGSEITDNQDFTLHIRSGGDKVVFDGGDNVGIGTSLPTARLHVAGTAGVDGIKFPDGTLQTSAASDEHSLNAADGSPVDAVFVNNTGQVGIGTSAPSHLLHVFGPARFRSNTSTNLLLTGGSDDAFIDFIKDSNTTASARIKMDGFSDQATHRAFLEFLTRGASDSDVVSRMRITDTGNVGIGTTDPTAKLHIQGNPANLKLAGSEITDNQDFTLHIRSGGDKVVFDGGDNVGIGTATPTNRFVAVGPGGEEGGVPSFDEVVARFRQTTTGTHSAVSADSLAGQDSILYLAENGEAKWGIRNDAVVDGTSVDDHFQLRYHEGGSNITILDVSSGNVDNTPPSTFRMAINGHFWPTTDNAYQLGSLFDRWTAVYAVNPFIQSSDARLKKDIATLDYGLRELLALRPVRFKWKNESDPRINLGLISQEVERIIPEAVVKDDSKPETPWALTYTTFIPVMIKAIQEQQHMIKSHGEMMEVEHKSLELLRKENAELRSRIERIEQELKDSKRSTSSG